MKKCKYCGEETIIYRMQPTVECICRMCHRTQPFYNDEEGQISMKTKVEKHKEICDYLNDLYARKNADYGDSFHLSYLDEGMAMPRIRLGDKFNRFKQLSKSGISQVNDESIRDTLLDLANYAIMTVLELDEEQGQTTSISS